MTHWTQKLIALGDTGERPCSDAVEWCRAYDSLESAWAACPRGDWLLWLVGRLAGPRWSESRRPLVRAAAECAMLALPYIHHEWVEGVALAALQACVAWSEGEASDEDLQLAYAYADAYAYAYAYADAYAAAYADAAAYAAAAAAAGGAARARILAQCADIVRAIIPCPVLP